MKGINEKMRTSERRNSTIADIMKFKANSPLVVIVVSSKGEVLYRGPIAGVPAELQSAEPKRRILLRANVLRLLI